MAPHPCQPVAWPVSASRVLYRAGPSWWSLAMLSPPMKWGIKPAACQVEPEVNSPFSTSTISSHPSFVRKYNNPAPRAPPPIITTRAYDFTFPPVRFSKAYSPRQQMIILESFNIYGARGRFFYKLVFSRFRFIAPLSSFFLLLN